KGPPCHSGGPHPPRSLPTRRPSDLVDDLTLRTAVVVPTPGNPLADGVLAALREVPVLEITIEEEEAALAALRRGERSLVVVLPEDRKSTRLNSSHGKIPYAVFCWKK